MNYRLYAAADRLNPIATHDCDNNFLADRWAREWVQASASTEDHVIEREDSGYSATLFRTVAGQWYIMPRTA
jgi:hypothetical protein